jgi:hypothetical protein
MISENIVAKFIHDISCSRSRREIRKFEKSSNFEGTKKRKCIHEPS